ncbi:MAG: dipeptidase [Bacillota bacterium]
MVFLAFVLVLYLAFNLLQKGGNIPYIIQVPPGEQDSVEYISVVVDTHSDTLIKMVNDKTWLPSVDIGENTPFDIDIPKLKKGGVDVQYFGAFTSGYYSGGKPDYLRSNSRLLSLINVLYWAMEKNSQHMGLARTVEDIKDLAGSGKISAVLSIEGAYSLGEGNGKELLHQYYDLGLRAIGLTWNHSNALGEGVNGSYMDGSPSEGGLTGLGREVVRELNRLGIIMDVSHMNEETFWDVMEVSDAPVMASHSGVYALRKHVRNLKDDQIRAIAKGGGVVQVVFYPKFLAVSKAGVGVATIVDHIEYIANLVGVEHVGIGSDFDGATMPEDLKDASMIPRLERELEGRGFDRDDIEKIMGNNTMRVMEQVWGRYAAGEGRNNAPVIEPLIDMGQAVGGEPMVLTAVVKAAEGEAGDPGSLGIIVDGREYMPEFNQETGRMSLVLEETSDEEFHVVTFRAAFKGGRVSRVTRIFRI